MSPANGNGEHIVVADDDEAVREIITTLLTARGYRVTCCADGIEALKHFNARPRGFDLVITDADMPNIGGGLAFGAGLGITLFGIMYMARWRRRRGSRRSDHS